jgi:hypothetical protein
MYFTDGRVKSYAAVFLLFDSPFLVMIQQVNETNFEHKKAQNE